MIAEVDKTVSAKFANMSLACAFLVVAIHCRPVNYGGWCSSLVVNLFGNGIATIAVPFFFLASGFFLAGHFNAPCSKWYGKELIKRCKSLLIPFVAFTLLYWGYKNCVVNIVQYGSGRPFLYDPLTLKAVGVWPFGTPILGPLWYLRGLMICVIVAPVILRAMRILGMLSTLLLLFVIYGILCPGYPLPRWSMVQELTMCGICPVMGFAYFATGIALRLSELRCFVHGWTALIVGFLFLIVKFCFVEGWMSVYIGYFAIPFLLIGVWYMMPMKRLPFVGLAFPVFLLHRFFILPFDRLNFLREGVFQYAILWLVVCFASIIVAIILKRFPRVSGILFGGR